MKLEVVVLPVSDINRAKRFYETLGFRLDIGSALDIPLDDAVLGRIVQA